MLYVSAVYYDVVSVTDTDDGVTESYRIVDLNNLMKKVGNNLDIVGAVYDTNQIRYFTLSEQTALYAVKVKMLSGVDIFIHNGVLEYLCVSRVTRDFRLDFTKYVDHVDGVLFLQSKYITDGNSSNGTLTIKLNDALMSTKRGYWVRRLFNVRDENKVVYDASDLTKEYLDRLVNIYIRWFGISAKYDRIKDTKNPIRLKYSYLRTVLDSSVVRQMYFLHYDGKCLKKAVQYLKNGLGVDVNEVWNTYLSYNQKRFITGLEKGLKVLSEHTSLLSVLKKKAEHSSVINIWVLQDQLLSAEITDLFWFRFFMYVGTIPTPAKAIIEVVREGFRDMQIDERYLQV